MDTEDDYGNSSRLLFCSRCAVSKQLSQYALLRCGTGQPQRLPRRVEAASLISHLDQLVWTRKRTESLFGLEYRFEIFIPRERRRWGCYVLHFLLGERLVARVDLKADRPSGRLLALATHYEPGADRAEVEPALSKEIATMEGWLGLGTVSFATTS